MLKLAPRDFWDLTFSEYWAMYNANYGHIPEPPSRKELLKQMMERPD